MFLAAIVGSNENKTKTANLINSIFINKGKRVSSIDSKVLANLDIRRMKSYISELSKNNVDAVIVKVDIYDLEKDIFKYLRFDVLIFSEKAEDLNCGDYELVRALLRKSFSLLKEKGIAIVNADDVEIVSLLTDEKHYTVTFGFNRKASITTSSIGDVLMKDNFMCCLQRTVYTQNGIKVEPQEYIIHMNSQDNDPYSVLAAASFAIVNGVEP